jgi:hypothetical protein
MSTSQLPQINKLYPAVAVFEANNVLPQIAAALLPNHFQVDRKRLQISVMRVGCAKNLNDTGQCGLWPCAHVQRLGGHPDGIDADQRNVSNWMDAPTYMAS